MRLRNGPHHAHAVPLRYLAELAFIDAVPQCLPELVEVADHRGRRVQVQLAAVGCRRLKRMRGPDWDVDEGRAGLPEISPVDVHDVLASDDVERLFREGSHARDHCA